MVQGEVQEQRALSTGQGTWPRSVNCRAGPARVCDRPPGGTSSTSHSLYGIGPLDVMVPVVPLVCVCSNRIVREES